MGRRQEHRQGDGVQGAARATRCISAPPGRTPKRRWRRCASSSTRRSTRTDGAERRWLSCASTAARPPRLRRRPARAARRARRRLRAQRGTPAEEAQRLRRRDRRGARSAGALAGASRRRRGRHSRLPDRRCSKTPSSPTPALRRARRRAAPPKPPGARRWRARSPATRPPTTSISGRAPATSPTSATACSPRLPAADADAGIAAGRDRARARSLALALSVDRLEPRRRHRALTAGSAYGHVATLARARGVPMIVGLGVDPPTLARRRAGAGRRRARGAVGRPDAGDARRVRGARRAARRARRAPRRRFATRPARHRGRRRRSPCSSTSPIADRTRRARSRRVRRRRAGAHRVPVRGRRRLPDEEAQFAAYARIVDWAGGPAGDDPHARRRRRQADRGPDARRREQSVPRPARHPALAGAPRRVPAATARAVPRGGATAPVEIMLPMVACRREVAPRARCSTRNARALRPPGVAARRPPLGIMVEAPAAAIAPDCSTPISSRSAPTTSPNMCWPPRATARRSRRSTIPRHPAVLRLIAGVAAHGAARGRKVSLCGDAGGDPRLVEPLLRAGLRALSVAPAARRRASSRPSPPSISRRRHERRAPRATRAARGLQDDAAQRARPPALRHAPAPRQRARQEPQLRLADLQSRLSGADPGAASRDHLRDLPFLAGREAGVSRGVQPRPSQPAEAAPRRARRLRTLKLEVVRFRRRARPTANSTNSCARRRGRLSRADAAAASRRRQDDEGGRP